MALSEKNTITEVQAQILKTKISEPLNHSKIQKLQQLLDKLTGSVPEKI